jgi:hypothetical protein
MWSTGTKSRAAITADKTFTATNLTAERAEIAEKKSPRSLRTLRFVLRDLSIISRAGLATATKPDIIEISGFFNPTKEKLK